MEKFVKSENVSNENNFFYTYLISQGNRFGYSESQLVRYCDGLKAFLLKYSEAKHTDFLNLLYNYYSDLTVSKLFNLTYSLRLFQIFLDNKKVLELVFEARNGVKTDLKSNPDFSEFLLNHCVIPAKKADVLERNLDFTIKLINTLKINNANFNFYEVLLGILVDADIHADKKTETYNKSKKDKKLEFILHCFKNFNKNSFSNQDFISLYIAHHKFSSIQYDLKFIKLLDSKLNLNYLLEFQRDEINKLYFIYKMKPELFEKVSILKDKSVTAYQFLLTVFENYKVASLFLYNYFHGGFNEMNETEFEWFMDVLKGRNLVYSKNLPFKLTKKIAHEFTNLNLEKPLGIKNGLIFAALKYHQVNTEFSMAILRKLSYLDNTNFWIETLTLLYNKGLHINKLDEFVDYIRFKVFRCEEYVNFNSISLKKLQKDIDDWHYRFYNSIPFKNEYTEFKKSNLEPFEYLSKEGDFQIVQLLKTEELIEEGQQLEHCVATYNSLCAKNYLSIFSLRKKNEQNEYHSLITIEVNQNEITQMRGLKNRKSNTMEKLIIKKWASKNQLKIV